MNKSLCKNSRWYDFLFYCIAESLLFLNNIGFFIFFYVIVSALDFTNLNAL